MATKAPLKSLRIKHFRGSTKDFSLKFDTSKSLTLIYGENGTGKTTISDAFDFVGNAKVGSLENRGLGVLKPYWPTLGQPHTNILVEVAMGENVWKAQATSKGVSVTPTDADRPKVEVLRRASILSLVQEAPKEKYDALKPFIDISLAEQAEAALRKQVKESESALNIAANRIAENRETLTRLHQESGSTEASFLVWAQAILQSPPSDPIQDVGKLRGGQTTIETVERMRDSIDSASAESQLAAGSLSSAVDTLAKIEAAALAEDAAFERILSAAKDHFAKHPVGDYCPLCESGERVADLADRVSARLANLKAVTDARTALRQAQSSAASKQAVFSSAIARSKQAAAVAREKVQLLADQWAAMSPALAAVLDRIAEQGMIDSAAVEVLLGASKSAGALITELEGKKTWYATVKTVYEQYQTNLDKQKVVSQVLPRLNAALVICENERKAFLDAILSSIAKEVGRLYEIIHPGEGLNKISLKLDPNKTGSVDLSAQFLSSQDQPPHAYFSESHLDSLGLCIFLALAALREPERTLVVMDDVLGSIDEPHVDRLIEMLYDESKKFRHTLITTHYQPWREKFRWGWLKNGQCEMMELGAWDANTGIATAKLSQAPLIELRQHLSVTPPLLQSACATAGVLLEAICDFLTVRYECDVPRKKGRLTLGDLLPKVCEKKLIAALRIEVKGADGSYSEVKIGDKLKALNEMAQLRNIFGCHYADLAHHLPQKDALDFATLVHEVGAALICDDEGWPGSDKSGSYWATRQETRRLHPLKKPS
jgi:ABC-type cobalamin/Fe3+-siderophores transport system ATPase subunit